MMKFIIGNWKMFPSSPKEAKAILGGIKRGIKSASKVKVVLCAPALFIFASVLRVGKTKIAIGGQDCFTEDEGAYTGETSPRALRALGATYVILGHSERRAMGETDKEVSKKVIAALRNKLTVILCVGEKERDQHGGYFNEVSTQLRASLDGCPKVGWKNLIIAYEPIWAIGSKAVRVATPADFREMSILIRRTLTEYFGKKEAFAVPVIYGGSVDDRNALGFLREGEADGLLVGRVSLDPEKFSAIIRSAHNIHHS
jgi:triosephosphate isomerase (TIM)